MDGEYFVELDLQINNENDKSYQHGSDFVRKIKTIHPTDYLFVPDVSLKYYYGTVHTQIIVRNYNKEKQIEST